MSINNIKNVMVIGAGGSLGECLCDLLFKNSYNVIAVDINENSLAHLYRIYNIPENRIYVEDVRNFDKLKAIIEYNKIDIVVNCAALKHVLWCEYNIKQAIEINIVANLELINYLKKEEKEFIFISSDKAINPKNVYAFTKQFTDYIIKVYDFKLVRGVNFINSNGSVLDIWEKQRRLNKSFTLVDNKKCSRYFITISQMAELIKEAIDNNDGKLEYIPSKVYKIYIHDLFNAYLKVNNIFECQIDKIFLPSNEKITEDLDFMPEVAELINSDDIANFLKGVL